MNGVQRRLYRAPARSAGFIRFNPPVPACRAERFAVQGLPNVRMFHATFRYMMSCSVKSIT